MHVYVGVAQVVLVRIWVRWRHHFSENPWTLIGSSVGIGSIGSIGGQVAYQLTQVLKGSEATDRISSLEITFVPANCVVKNLT